jgi:hypothetical protein
MVAEKVVPPISTMSARMTDDDDDDAVCSIMVFSSPGAAVSVQRRCRKAEDRSELCSLNGGANASSATACHRPRKNAPGERRTVSS